jgi:hypothetical protein
MIDTKAGRTQERQDTGYALYSRYRVVAIVYYGERCSGSAESVGSIFLGRLTLSLGRSVWVR